MGLPILIYMEKDPWNEFGPFPAKSFLSRHTVAHFVCCHENIFFVRFPMSLADSIGQLIKCLGDLSLRARFSLTLFRHVFFFVGGGGGGRGQILSP